MNDASNCMKDWRRAQTSTVMSVPPQLPQALQESCIAALAALWREATDMANDALRTAQAGWEVERADTEVLSKQMADACDLQATDLEEAHAEIHSLKERIDETAGEVTKIRTSHAIAERNRESAARALAEAQAKLVEVGQRVDEVRSERDAARAETSAIRAELATAHASYPVQIERIRAEARRDIELERERGEREAERLQNALTLALQHPPADLPGKAGASGQRENARKKRQTRKPKPDGDASGNGKEGSAVVVAT